ncbi:MAG TPA: hypothetical protein VHE37_16690 [Nevskiaceae bacterium]|nr:hypothetical protein [Nevskiaceae bacterium]
MPESLRRHGALLLPALIALALYWPCVHFEFLWDDGDLLLRSASLRQWSSLWSSINHAFLTYGGYYRPLPLLTLGLEQIAAPGPWLPHLDAVLLHALNCLLLGLLARTVALQLGEEARAARIGLLAGAIYACHPVLIETVAWISSRFDLLLISFSLCLLLADRLLLGAARAITVSICFMAAALSKEMAVALPLLLPLWHLAFEPRAGWHETLAAFRRRGHVQVYLGVLASGLLYLALRYQGLGRGMADTEWPVEKFSLLHLVLVLKTIGTDIMLMLFPFTTLSPLHSYAGASAVDFYTWAGAAFALLCSGLALAVARGLRGPAILVLCCAATLLPVSNIIPVPLRDCYTSERFLGLPLVFLALGLSIGLLRALSSMQDLRVLQRALPALLAVFWFGLCVLNISVTLPLWRNSLSLWTWSYARAPDSPTAQINLTASYFALGDYGRARVFMEQVFQRQHDAGIAPDPDQYFQYLTTLVYTDAPSAAVKPLYAALEQLPPSRNLQVQLRRHDQLSWLYLLRGHAPQAVRHFNAVLSIDPANPAAHFGLGVMQLAAGQQADGQNSIDYAMQHGHPSIIAKWRAQLPQLITAARASSAHAEDL